MLNAFDKQFCEFTNTKENSVSFGDWFNLLEVVFNIWGQTADTAKDSYIARKLNIKDTRAIPAKDAAHCIMVWAALYADDLQDLEYSMKYVRPTVEFFNSLENTTFYFSF